MAHVPAIRAVTLWVLVSCESGQVACAVSVSEVVVPGTDSLNVTDVATPEAENEPPAELVAVMFAGCDADQFVTTKETSYVPDSWLQVAVPAGVLMCQANATPAKASTAATVTTPMRTFLALFLTFVPRCAAPRRGNEARTRAGC